MENCLTINKYNSLSGPQTETGIVGKEFICAQTERGSKGRILISKQRLESRGRCRPHERKFLHILYLINLSKFCSCLLLYFLYA